MNTTLEQASKLAFTIKEVAKLLSVSPNTVRNLIYSGELSSIKIGRAVRVTADDLHAYIKNSRCN